MTEQEYSRYLNEVYNILRQNLPPGLEHLADSFILKTKEGEAGCVVATTTENRVLLCQTSPRADNPRQMQVFYCTMSAESAMAQAKAMSNAARNLQPLITIPRALAGR